MRLGVVMVLGAAIAGCESQSSVRPEEQDRIDLIAVSRAADDAYRRKDWATSEERYALLTREMPLEPEPWFRLGNIYARTDRPDRAIGAYREAVIRDPKHLRAWHNMGVVQLQQAARSFAEIHEVAEPSDPLYQRSRETIETIDNLIHKGKDD